MILFTNHLPRVGSTDSGTWRRLIVVPFNAVIQPGAGVQNYGEVLAKECGGAILAWGIEGAVNFVRNGFKLDIPDAVAEATEEYRQREDWLTNFINERCIRDPNAREGARVLYLEYKAWAQDGGEFVRRESDFATSPAWSLTTAGGGTGPECTPLAVPAANQVSTAVRRVLRRTGQVEKPMGAQCPRFSTNNLIKEEYTWKRPSSARRWV